MSIDRCKILAPEEARTDYLNEIAGIVFIAESHIVNGVLDEPVFHASLKGLLEELGRDRAICSFEEVHHDAPELIGAQPDDFLIATRLIAEEFETLYQEHRLTVEAIREFSRRLEQLRTDPRSEPPPENLDEIMGPEVAVTTYINELSALYSIAKAMIEHREQVRQLEHIFDIFNDFEGGQLARPFTERFSAEVLRGIPSEFQVTFDGLAEELNAHFREQTLTENHVVDIVHRMEALKKQLIGGN